MVEPVEAQLTAKGELKGIIYKLKQKFDDEIIIRDYVYPSAFKDYPNLKNETLVKWNYYQYMSGPGSQTNLPWIQLSFPNCFIFPTAYSLRGVNNGASCYSKSWDVYGIHDGDENKGKESWELLGANDTSQSTYCVTTSSYCNSLNIGSFTLKPMQSSVGFKHLRWVSRETAGCTNYYMTTSAVDVYGTLSLSSILRKAKRRGVTCYSRCGTIHYIIAIMFSNQISE